MITFRRVRETLELAACGPVELSGVDYDASDCRTMTTNPFGRAVNHDIGPQIDGANNITTWTTHQMHIWWWNASLTGTKGVVYDERDAMVVSNLGKLWNRRNIVFRVSNTANLLEYMTNLFGALTSQHKSHESCC